MNFQQEKQVVRRYHAALDSAYGDDLIAAMSAHCDPNLLWRGYYPFNEIKDAKEVAIRFWMPLKTALTHMQRRDDIFFAGRNQMDGFRSVWVTSMGHLVGLFDKPWLGINPTEKMAFLRYCTFHRVLDGKVVETAMYFDIPHFMEQAGQNPFPEQTAQHLVQPGPMTHDGLLYDQQHGNTGEKTLATINKMISDLGQWQNDLPLEEELALNWHDDMIWWGPAGIGATYTIERYAKQHARPFRSGFTNRSGTDHVARLAEGPFGGFFGWPNFTATPTGGFMHLPGNDAPGEFRVIDIYRREGEKLKENWVFIDLLHFWKSQGRDFLAETTGYSYND